jgi:N6-adenosine-specific RNA methylase IME4
MNQTAAILPFAQPLEQWEAEGRTLGERERSAKSLMWDIGDWWNRGEAYGERAQIVTAADWTGPTHANCRHLGSVAARFPSVMRITELTFDHHRLVAPLSDEAATPLLQWCADTDPPHSTQELKTRIQQLWRSKREAQLAGKIEQATQSIGHQVYGVLYADPPWRLEPYSRETGLNRAADNHYPTMERDALFDMEVMRTAPAKDCVLFCWATVPMLEDALQWMAAYGFAYRSHCVWVKDAIGTGYWFRNQHEMLLVGVRGEVPAPAAGTQFPSVIRAPLGEHSAKPAAFAEMIEELFPSLPALELFARGPRLGWDVWGNEAQ